MRIFGVFSITYISDFRYTHICNKEQGNITCENNEVLDIHEAWFGRISENISNDKQLALCNTCRNRCSPPHCSKNLKFGQHKINITS